MIERSEDAADKVGVAAKRPNFVAEPQRRNVIRSGLCSSFQRKLESSSCSLAIDH